MNCTTKGDRLRHERYNDGLGKTIDYVHTSDQFYLVRRIRRGQETTRPIPIEDLRAAVADEEDLRKLLETRIDDLKSLVSMDFDTSRVHVAALSLRQEKHRDRYLDDISSCYCYVTLEEHWSTCDGFRSSSGDLSTLLMPLYLTWDHALSSRNNFHGTFTELVNVNRYDRDSYWHDLWVPDTIAHLINHAIVDFAKGVVSEPAVQFVLDALRLMIFCCEAPALGEETDEEQWSPSTPRMFPHMVPLMKKFLEGFKHYPCKRSRDVVPDLGDLLQWLAVVELLDNSFTWKDLVHSVVVETMRRKARWVSKYLVQEFSLRPKFFRERTNEFHMVPDKSQPGKKLVKKWVYKNKRRETRSEMVRRFVKDLPKQRLLELWWEQCQVGARVVMYSHAFYKTLAKGRNIHQFKARYDKVLGAAYPEDIAAIKDAKVDIECVNSLSEMFEQLQYPLSDDDIHRLCIWAIEAQDGYHTTSRTDPLDDGWKTKVKPKKHFSCNRSYNKSEETKQDSQVIKSHPTRKNGTHKLSAQSRNQFASLHFDENTDIES